MNKGYVDYRLYQLGRDRKWLSEETGIEYNYLSKLLNGNNKPGLDTLKKIGDAINADYNQLLEEKGEANEK